MEDCNIPVIGGVKVKAPHFFHHNGKFPTENVLKILKTFYSKMKTKKIESIEISKAMKIFAPEKLRVKILFPIAHIISKKRELKIEIGADCRMCKKCVRECPAGALLVEDKIKINFGKCIHCYHCVNTCPFNAINCDIYKLEDIIKVNKRIVGVEKPANKIYMDI